MSQKNVEQIMKEEEEEEQGSHMISLKELFLWMRVMPRRSLFYFISTTLLFRCIYHYLSLNRH